MKNVVIEGQIHEREKSASYISHIFIWVSMFVGIVIVIYACLNGLKKETDLKAFNIMNDGAIIMGRSMKDYVISNTIKCPNEPIVLEYKYAWRGEDETSTYH